jgi:hypothetical protein
MESSFSIEFFVFCIVSIIVYEHQYKKFEVNP